MDCLLWQGYIDPRGYGRRSVAGRRVPAHRAAYEQAYGAVPKGLVVDHRCRVRACVEPRHLEAVTNHRNLLRGASPPGRSCGTGSTRKTSALSCAAGRPASSA
ncbi:HNH endonuclease signature motif containing protein [Streptomyces sp. NPDC005180]|uniref:HNH endonuclease signature motif containing protein n=1 Tax=Streptomyces sp. NPDC005180 TaxID=3156868 RepID=UPI0033B42231